MTQESEVQIHLPPKSRFRVRADGGMDDTYRVQFVSRLSPAEMRSVIRTLQVTVDEGANFGMQALTMVRFIGQDACVFRIWCKDARSARLNKEYELLHRLSMVHEIRDVDGIKYSFLGRDVASATSPTSLADE